MAVAPTPTAFVTPEFMKDEVVWVAVYLRVSTDDQAKTGFGLNVQREVCMDYVVRQAHHNWKIFDFYVDDGVSGTLTERAEIDRLLKDAAANDIKFVVVARLDRHSRDEYVGLYLEKILGDVGVTTVSATQDPDPYHLNDVARGVQRVIDGSDRRKILDNTNKGRQKAAEAGYWTGGRTPYGYQATGKNHQHSSSLIINPDEKKVILRIYELMVKQGLSLTETAEALNAAGMLTRGRKKWTAANLRGRLTSDGLAGVSVFRKTDPNGGAHRAKALKNGAPALGVSVTRNLPEILTESQHAALMSALKQHGNSGRSNYLLTGHLIGLCGGNYAGGAIKGARRYRCSPGCNDRTFDAKIVEDAVWSKISEFLKDRRKMEELAKSWIKQLPGDRERHEAMREAIEVDVAKTRKLLEGIAITLADRDLDPDDRMIQESSKVTLMTRYKEKKAALDQVDKILAGFDAAEAEVTRIAAMVDDARIRVDDMSFSEKRALLKLLRVRIVLAEPEQRGSSGPRNPLELWHRENGVLIPSDPDDKQWEQIVAMLTARKSRLVQYKAPREHLRSALCAMLHRLRTGCRWEELPEAFAEVYGGYEVIRGVQSRLWHKGLWTEIVSILGTNGGVPIATPSLLPKLKIRGRFNPALLGDEEHVVSSPEFFSPETFGEAKILHFELDVA